jgi:hypothetical protein
MGPAPPRDKPIPVNCLQCGQPMSLYDERAEFDAQGRPDHIIRIYFCPRHGFFHVSDRMQLTPDL